jgi:Outer membrane protein beta-barrel domain
MASSGIIPLLLLHKDNTGCPVEAQGESGGAAGLRRAQNARLCGLVTWLIAVKCCDGCGLREDSGVHGVSAMRQHILVLTFLGLSCSLSAAYAQLVSFGVKGGIPITDPAYTNANSPRYTVGPSVEFRLPAHFAVEVDALYQRLSNNSTFSTISAGTSSVTSNYSSTLKSNFWQFPIIGKYYFGHEESRWRPFVGTGYELGSVWNHQKGSVTTITGTTSTTSPLNSNYRSPTMVGAMVNGGMRYKRGRFAMLPEVRYSFWGSNPYPIRRNALTFLMGVSF